MKQLNSAKGGEFLPPPFFIATLAAAIIFSVTAVAFAEAPAINKYRAAGWQPIIVLTIDQAVN